MDLDNSIKIKKEKVDNGYENSMSKAESLPLPMQIKEEKIYENTVKVESKQEGKTKENGVLAEVKEEHIEKKVVTPPRPLVVKMQAIDTENNDELSFLDELSNDIDEIIPVEVESIPIISIDDDDAEEMVTKSRKLQEEVKNYRNRKASSENEFQNIEDTEKNRKKHKKKTKKRKSSNSPVDIKPNIKKLNDVLAKSKKNTELPNDEFANSENSERYSRKVYNYNHSSVPTVEKKNRIENLLSSIKIEQKMDDIEKLINDNEKMQKECVRPPSPKRIKMENTSYEIQINQVLKNCNKALKRLRIFKSDPHFGRFLYTPTKLIIPLSDVEKEYRSPLLRSSHVRFKFSSTNPQIHYNEFNIEVPSESITRVSKLLGLEIRVLNEWINNFGNNNRSGNNNQGGKNDRKPFDNLQNVSTFHVSASTQTIDIPCEICLKRTLCPKSSKTVAVSVKPETYEIGTQTAQQNELPILTILQSLNANQLLALNDFTVLLCEQNWETANTSSRLNIRDKLLHYFQEGQQPCNVPGIAGPQPQLIQQSVSSGLIAQNAVINTNNSMPNYNLTIDPRFAPPPPPTIQYHQYNQNHLQNVASYSNVGYPAQPQIYSIQKDSLPLRSNDPRLNRNVDTSRYRK